MDDILEAQQAIGQSGLACGAGGRAGPERRNQRVKGGGGGANLRRAPREHQSIYGRRNLFTKGELTMDPNTGRIRTFENEDAARKTGFIPIRRDLTAKEKADKQIQMYSPCGCGSGIKFKFCCHVARGGTR